MSPLRPVSKVSVLLVLLVAILPLTPAQAADRYPSRQKPFHFTIAKFLPEVWSAIQSIWAKEGSGVDPFGNPKPNNTTEPPPSCTSGSDTSPG